MSQLLDFKTKYEQRIFAISPFFFEYGIFGWAMINRNAEPYGGTENVPIIHRSGLLKLFSTPFSLNTMGELCEQFTAIWRNDSGYSKEPLILVVEQPEISPGSSIQSSNLTDSSVLIGMLICELNPKLTLIPTSSEWKGAKKGTQTHAEIENINDYHSKRALKRDLDMVALHNRHNVYDAVGLGIYGVEVHRSIKPMPRLFRGASAP